MNRKTVKKLEALLATLPTIECKKLCTHSCGPIAMFHGEAQIIRQAGRKIEKCGDDLTCKFLEAGRCTIYAVRPSICRLWGLVNTDEMRCPHGCVPSRWMTKAEGYEFMGRVEKIAGGGRPNIKTQPANFYQIIERRYGTELATRLSAAVSKI